MVVGMIVRRPIASLRRLGSKRRSSSMNDDDDNDESATRTGSGQQQQPPPEGTGGGERTTNDNGHRDPPMTEGSNTKPTTTTDGGRRKVSIQIPDETSSQPTSRKKSSRKNSARLSRRRSSIILPDVPEDMDCPICLDSMNKADFDHPLQCPSRACGFNFCRSCIESLITSSKDDYMEASDGNMHVKVFLHCPNCRSDLSSTIRDTVLLRKADTVKAAEGLSDEELTASQLRLKQVLDNVEVKEALVDARKRESEFFGLDTLDGDGSWDPEDDDDDEEEMGVEADIKKGVHKSVRWPKSPSEETTNASKRKDKKVIDLTLFQGLEISMTKDEQQYVTKLMTSGEPSDLASAAEIMHGIRDLSLHGQTPTKRLNKMSSVFVLIEEAKEAHAKADAEAANSPDKVAETAAQRINAAAARNNTSPQLPHPQSPRTPTNTKSYDTNPRGIVTAAQTRQVQHEQNQFAIFMQTHPLPVRMPKYVELELHNPSSSKFALTFCDDIWDGTVMDAFTKITISWNGKHVHKKKRPNTNKNNRGGVHNVINGGLHDVDFADGRIDVEQNRVLVASVKSEGGRKGVMKGDVVTHVNGEEFVGGTAKELMDLIRMVYEKDDGNHILRLVLNAELSTAEALRRRALIND